MRCNECSALMINGVCCHEIGCPNRNAKYESGEWIQYTQCRECGDEVRKGETCNCTEPVEDADEPAEDTEIPLRSMTFGVMPTEAEFLSAFRAIVGTGTYAIVSRGTDAEVMPSGNYDAEELFALVCRLSDISNRDNGETTDDYAELAGACASAILSTLRFEWV